MMITTTLSDPYPKQSLGAVMPGRLSSRASTPADPAFNLPDVHPRPPCPVTITPSPLLDAPQLIPIPLPPSFLP
ncbi:hypothetical protein PBY51_010285 [Eleginops maclovinus]|uniref:Uncharacterized protein n=1 Tax=Eleginops maclovinus TaxID=56733 RepID=A0AAN7XBB1_ELEMC|nr:hypothetical protein PBY51_010285 [Eleginops maclovinus]